MSTHVIVIGAGVTGLVAAHALAADERVEVTVLEASDRVGGQVCTIDFDGARVDVGAEAMHLGAPHVAQLVGDLGLAERAIGAAPGTSVLVTRRGPVPLPAGVGPTGPTRLLPVLRSRILSLRGLVRAGLEPLMARRKVAGDIGVGEFTRMRFGREVTDTFVDPLLGNLHGGDVHQLSLEATAPQLVPGARAGESMVLKNLRRATPGAAPAPGAPGALPAFASWPGGLSTFTETLASQLTVRTSSRVSRVVRDDDRWTVTLADGETLTADRVLFTSPGAETAELLTELAPQASRALAAVPTASVATVVLGYDKQAVAGNRILREHNGVLVPGPRVRTMKAATNLSRKWPELGAEHHLLRASVGRSDDRLAVDLTDSQLVRRVAEELGSTIGLDAPVAVSTVVRWPQAMPQLTPGHLARMKAARADLARQPGLYLAGSFVDGLGVGGTVRSGQAAAKEILGSLPAYTSEDEKTQQDANHQDGDHQ